MAGSEGIRKSSITERTRFFRQFLVTSVSYSLALLTVFALILSWQIVNLVETSKWVDHTDIVIAQASHTLRLAIDAETGERGFLITGNPTFLQPYYFAQSNISQSFNTLQKEASSMPGQRQRVIAMRYKYANWLAQADVEIALEKTLPSRVRDVLNHAQGKALMDSLRSQFDQFTETERQFRLRRAERTNQATWTALTACIVLSIACGVILGFVTVTRSRNFADLYEEALVSNQKDRELIAATLHGIGDAVMVTDSLGRVSMMNPVAEELTGWKITEAIGKDAKVVFNIVNESSRKVVESPIDRVLREGVIVGLANHTALVRRDGTEVPIDDSGAPIFDDQQKLVGVVLVFRDITDRKLAEKQIADAYEREHRIAENLQRALIRRPAPDAVPRLEIETCYHPALSEATVGGDFFDIFTLDNHKVALIVGDVSGKGLEAASRTAEMKFALRAHIYENQQLSLALTRFNRYVCHVQASAKDDESFLCLTAVLVDTSSGVAAFCAAGVEKPLILPQSGEAVEVDVNGAPIGVVGDYIYQEKIIVMKEGDMIALATDGLTEARRKGEFLGNTGLAQLLKQNTHPEQPLSVTVTAVIDKITEYTENHIADDICLLLTRFK